ncbi:hypothetical protein HerbRD11066_78660 [Herbidospora sp. RD11066]
MGQLLGSQNDMATIRLVGFEFPGVALHGFRLDIDGEFGAREVGGQAVLGRQNRGPTPWLTERHG